MDNPSPVPSTPPQPSPQNREGVVSDKTFSSGLSADALAARWAARVVPTLRHEAEVQALRERVRARMPRPHAGQMAVLDDPARFRVVACSRRFGKTTLGMLEIVTRALDGARCWWLAPTYAQGQDVWRIIKKAVKDFSLYINNSERRMELPGGGVIEVKTANNPDNLRGAGLDFAVLDEAAFMAESVWPEVVRPMLLTSKGGALFLSTPFGMNWFHQLYVAGLDPEQGAWSAFHYSIYDAPHIDRGEIDSLQRQSTERVWQQEYLAEFLLDNGAVFRGVDAVMTLDREKMQPETGKRYVAGVDWGRENDYTVVAVMDADDNRLVALDRFNQIDYHFQRARLEAIVQRWGVTAIWAEGNSMGGPNIEELQRAGLPVHAFQTTAKSKPPLIEGLALAIEKGEVSLIQDDVLRAELVSYQVERRANGYSYNAPAGGHDDTVIALALAWHGVNNRKPLVLW